MSSTLPAVDLAQHTVLLDFVGRDIEHALFCSTEDGRQPTKLLLRMGVYEEMGSPEQVTMSVRPGKAFTDLDVAFQTSPGE